MCKTTYLTFISLFLYFVQINIAQSYEPLTSSEFLENKLLIDTAISPNGKYLSTIWYIDKSNTNIVTIQDLTQESKPVIGTIKERITLPQKVYWASNDRMIMMLSGPSYLEAAKKKLKEDPKNFNIYDYKARTIAVSVNHLGKDLVQLRRKNNNKVIKTIRDFLPSDAKHIMMENRHKGRREFLKVNIHTGKGEVITSGGKDTIRFINNDKGEPLYRLDYLSVAKAYEIFEYQNTQWKSIDKIRLRSISDELGGDYDSYNSDLIGVNNNELIYLKANESTGFKEVISIDTKTKEKKVLVSLINKSVSRIITKRQSAQVTGYSFIDTNIMRNVYFDKQKQITNTKVLRYFPDDNYSLLDSSADKKHWIIKTNTPNEQAYYLYHTDTDKLELYSTTYKKLLTDNLGIPANVSYKARDNLLIHSYLLLPPTYIQGERYPLIVLPHGGPLSRNYSTFDLFAQFLATRGYIVIQPNFRGSSGYGKEFEELGYKQWGGTMQDDLEDSVNFLVKSGYADKNKVCIVGSSYGGYAALMGVVKTPELYQCAVSINGISDIKKMLKNTNKTFKNRKPILKYLREAYGDVTEDDNYFRKNSPIHHINKIKKPILILAGEKDTVVQFEQSKTFATKLKKSGKQVETYYSKWGKHNLFYYSDCREEGYKKIESFLATHLKVPIITKPNQVSIKKKTSFWQSNDESCFQ